MGRVGGLVLVIAMASLAAAPVVTMPARGAAGSTVRVSVGTGGAQATGGLSGSGRGSISADGRFVAFQSDATNLVPDDTNRQSDIFVLDRRTGVTTLVSATPTGHVGNSASEEPRISRDGRYVLFRSFSSDLVPNDLNGQNDLFVRDLLTETTVLVSVSTSGVQANRGVNAGVGLSGNGRFAVWASAATNLVPMGLDEPLMFPRVHVFVRDLALGTTTRVSVNSAGQPADALSSNPAISLDGRFVTFATPASNLGSGRQPSVISDVYLHDNQTGETALVSVGLNGALSNAIFFDFFIRSAVTPDGRYVAFTSTASNLVPGDTNGSRDTFVRDRVLGMTTRVSVSSAGVQGNAESSVDIAVSDDGRFVAFDSRASNLVEGDTNAGTDVFLHDMVSGETSRVSLTDAGGQSAGGGAGPDSMTPDAQIVVFTSAADDLVVGDTNRVSDSFIRILAAANTPPSVSLRCPGPRLFIHDGVTISGAFSDPDVGQTWTATFDGFDGQAGPAPLPLAPDHSFTLSKTASEVSARAYRITIEVIDSGGASSHASCEFVALPKRAMLYLHGTTGRSNQIRTRNDFPFLIGRLFDMYAVLFYDYYEDRAHQAPDRTCFPGTQRTIPPIDPKAGMPLDPATPDPPPGICDSNDDVELNAVLLDGDIQELAAQFDKVTLISNSGGTAIVRAYLAYASAAAAHDPPRLTTSSLDLVDLVVTLEGAQTGSYLAAVYSGADDEVSRNPDLSRVRDDLLDLIRRSVGHDPTRPLFEDVTPGSPIIRYTSTTVPVPNRPHYLNVDADIQLHVHQSYFLIPYRTSIYSIGDGVFKPGDDDPRVVTELGGARFLPSAAGRGAASTEWELPRIFNVNIDDSPVGGPVFAKQIADILLAPEMHQNFGARMNALCVRFEGRVRTLDAVLFAQIARLDTGPARAAGLDLGHQAAVPCP